MSIGPAITASPTLRLTASAVTANTTMIVPAGYAIREVYIRNTTANAVTGGIRIGTTDGGADVVVALAVAGSAFVAVGAAAILLKLFSASAAQTLYVQAVVAWNSASVDIAVIIERAVP